MDEWPADAGHRFVGDVGDGFPVALRKPDSGFRNDQSGRRSAFMSTPLVPVRGLLQRTDWVTNCTVHECREPLEGTQGGR